MRWHLPFRKKRNKEDTKLDLTPTLLHTASNIKHLYSSCQENSPVCPPLSFYRPSDCQPLPPSYNTANPKSSHLHLIGQQREYHHSGELLSSDEFGLSIFQAASDHSQPAAWTAKLVEKKQKTDHSKISPTEYATATVGFCPHCQTLVQPIVNSSYINATVKAQQPGHHTNLSLSRKRARLTELNFGEDNEESRTLIRSTTPTNNNNTQFSMSMSDSGIFDQDLGTSSPIPPMASNSHKISHSPSFLPIPHEESDQENNNSNSDEVFKFKPTTSSMNPRKIRSNNLSVRRRRLHETVVLETDSDSDQAHEDVISLARRKRRRRRRKRTMTNSTANAAARVNPIKDQLSTDDVFVPRQPIMPQKVPLSNDALHLPRYNAPFNTNVASARVRQYLRSGATSVQQIRDYSNEATHNPTTTQKFRNCSTSDQQIRNTSLSAQCLNYTNGTANRPYYDMRQNVRPSWLNRHLMKSPLESHNTADFYAKQVEGGLEFGMLSEFSLDNPQQDGGSGMANYDGMQDSIISDVCTSFPSNTRLSLFSNTSQSVDHDESMSSTLRSVEEIRVGLKQKIEKLSRDKEELEAKFSAVHERQEEQAKVQSELTRDVDDYRKYLIMHGLSVAHKRLDTQLDRLQSSYDSILGLKMARMYKDYNSASGGESKRRDKR